MARDTDLGNPPIPETFREVLEDILGVPISNIQDIKSLSDEQVEKLKEIKVALDLVLGEEVNS